MYQSCNAAAKKNFAKIFTFTIAGTVAFMTLFGCVCYISFGASTHAVITFNLCVLRL